MPSRVLKTLIDWMAQREIESNVSTRVRLFVSTCCLPDWPRALFCECVFEFEFDFRLNLTQFEYIFWTIASQTFIVININSNSTPRPTQPHQHRRECRLLSEHWPPAWIQMILNEIIDQLMVRRLLFPHRCRILQPDRHQCTAHRSFLRRTESLLYGQSQNIVALRWSADSWQIIRFVSFGCVCVCDCVYRISNIILAVVCLHSLSDTCTIRWYAARVHRWTCASIGRVNKFSNQQSMGKVVHKIRKLESVVVVWMQIKAMDDARRRWRRRQGKRSCDLPTGNWSVFANVYAARAMLTCVCSN